MPYIYRNKLAFTTTAGKIIMLSNRADSDCMDSRGYHQYGWDIMNDCNCNTLKTGKLFLTKEEYDRERNCLKLKESQKQKINESEIMDAPISSGSRYPSGCKVKNMINFYGFRKLANISDSKVTVSLTVKSRKNDRNPKVFILHRDSDVEEAENYIKELSSKSKSIIVTTELV